MIDIMTRFEKIPIDKTSISQGELDIDNKTRSNFFAWNGQFSPQFIEALLSHYAHDGDVVIDPFAGSGTTLCDHIFSQMKNEDLIEESVLDLGYF